MWGSEQFPPLGKCLQLDYRPRFIANLRCGTGLCPVSLSALCPVTVPTLCILFYFLFFYSMYFNNRGSASQVIPIGSGS